MAKDINSEINAHEKKLAELRAEITRLESLPKDIHLAERLHSLMCHWNHTDGCSWFYENWDSPGYARERYLKKARNLITKCNKLSVDQIVEVIEIAEE